MEPCRNNGGGGGGSCNLLSPATAQLLERGESPLSPFQGRSEWLDGQPGPASLFLVHDPLFGPHLELREHSSLPGTTGALA